MVAFETICMPTMCFLQKVKFWFFYECLKTLRSVNCCTAYSVYVEDVRSTPRRFFTAYSVHAEYFLPHTQQAWNIFFCILSRREIISKICHPALLCQFSRLGIFNYPILSTRRRFFYRLQYSTRLRFFTAYSVQVGDFLPHTQYTQHNFYRILSRQRLIFNAHSVISKETK